MVWSLFKHQGLFLPGRVYINLISKFNLKNYPACISNGNTHQLRCIKINKSLSIPVRAASYGSSSVIFKRNFYDS